MQFRDQTPLAFIPRLDLVNQLRLALLFPFRLYHSSKDKTPARVILQNQSRFKISRDEGSLSPAVGLYLQEHLTKETSQNRNKKKNSHRIGHLGE